MATPTPSATDTPTSTPVPAATPAATPTATPTQLPSTPASLGLNPFYEKYLDAGGLPVVASSKVPDAALVRARELIDEMLANRPDIRATLAESGRKVTVVAASEVITDIPEFRDIYESDPGTDWNKRVQGGGLSGNLRDPSTAVWEGNLLCYGDDVYPNEDIFVHEFAHTVLDHGVERQAAGTEFRTRLQTAYQEAIDAGLWHETYAGENSEEYWAEGVQSWFGLNDPPGRIHNEIDTRSELESYDPALAGLILEIFGDTTVESSCHGSSSTRPIETANIRGVVLGPNGELMDGIGLWAWQGNDINGWGVTAPDGTFDIRVPDGEFTLDVYVVPGDCSFVGWYGPGGFTTTRRNATRIEIDGADATGIEIRLTDAPKDLPFIEHCSNQSDRTERDADS